jgi:hypothetical protein
MLVILRAFDSNFYMLNAKLCVDLIKPFFIFKKNQDLVNVSFETIDNPEYADVMASNGDFEHWFIKWSTIADDVCNYFITSKELICTPSFI